MKTFVLPLLLVSTVACSNGSDSSNEAAAVAAPSADTSAGVAPAADAAAPVTETPLVIEETAPEVVEPSLVVKAEVDASNKDLWTHLDLDTGKIVEATDASWDLAFKRTSIKMNTAEGGLVKADVVKDSTFDAIASVPVDAVFAADEIIPNAVKETQGLFFHKDEAWYSYDMEIHVISSRNYVYFIQSNGGQSFKFSPTDYYSADRLPGFIQVQYQALAAAAAE